MDKKTKVYRIITVCLAAALVVSFFMLEKLNSKMDSLRSNYNNQILNIREEINSIYGNVDRKLKKQASLLSDMNYEIGSYDVENGKIPVIFKAVPKIISDGIRIFVEVEGEKTELSREGECFVGTALVGMFVGDSEKVLLTIEENGQTKTEILEDVYISSLFDRVLPHLFADMTGTSHYGDDYVRVEAGFSVEQAVAEDSAVRFKSVSVIEEKNGKETDRRDITDEVVKNDSYNTRYTHTFEASKGDEIKIYVVAEDSLGYIHKCLVSYLYRTENGDAPVTTSQGESIYASDGTLLYGEEI